MFNIGICDDSEEFRKKLANHIQKYSQRHSIETEIIEFSFGYEVLDYCKNSKDNRMIDVLFLDVEMEAMSGIECKDLLKNEPLVWRICFVTNHQEAVFESFSVKTMGYIIKSFDLQKVDTILDSLIKEKNEVKALSYISVSGEKKEILIDNISYIEAEGSYVLIHLSNGEMKPIVISKKLGQIEEELKGTSFIRVHRSYIVNMADIRAVGKELSMESTNNKIPLGNRYKAFFTTQFHQFTYKMIIRGNA